MFAVGVNSTHCRSLDGEFLTTFWNAAPLWHSVLSTFKRHDTSTACPKASLRTSSALGAEVSSPAYVEGPRVGVVGDIPRPACLLALRSALLSPFKAPTWLRLLCLAPLWYSFHGFVRS